MGAPSNSHDPIRGPDWKTVGTASLLLLLTVAAALAPATIGQDPEPTDTNSPATTPTTTETTPTTEPTPTTPETTPTTPSTTPTTPTTTSTTPTVPRVTLSLSPAELIESGGASTITAHLSATNSNDVTVQLRFAGSATSSDFQAPSTITIPAGATSGTGQLTSVDDRLDENPETVVVSVASATNADTSSAQPVTATIQDDDPSPSVRLEASEDRIREAAGSSVVTALLSAVSGRDVNVQLAFSGSATFPQDYSRTGTSILIPAGATSGTITITATQDAEEEPKETIVIDIVQVDNGLEHESQRRTIELQDDDDGNTPTTSSTTPTTSTTTSTTRSSTPTTTPSTSSPATTPTTPTSGNVGTPTTSTTTATTTSSTPAETTPPGPTYLPPPITTTFTTTDSAGQTYEVVQTFTPTEPQSGNSVGNHTTGFKAQRQRPLEGESTPALPWPLVIVGLAGALALAVARRRDL